ncbi:acyl carrier protein [Streptomyces hoynatensis]|uniref:Acyl carrier protein n=1 Tax=Streptomyces hoynatensis TaxID=1141874 RepID=A0A3A9ZFV5_9ACTN|nr:acyl carrier protein [Streptomyces hoynatensis]RKN47025.1 acyl carrier protein [Streptomyces hoynatensis]
MSADAGEIEQFITRVLVDAFDAEEDGLGVDTTLRQLSIDSLGGVELSLALKKEYGVSFVAGEIQVDFSVTDIAELVRSKQRELGAVGS